VRIGVSVGLEGVSRHQNLQEAGGLGHYWQAWSFTLARSLLFCESSRQLPSSVVELLHLSVKVTKTPERLSRAFKAWLIVSLTLSGSLIFGVSGESGSLLAFQARVCGGGAGTTDLGHSFLALLSRSQYGTNLLGTRRWVS